MFSIICRACAAKLKVKNSAAIGQRLACPKCGEMVEVQPPEGWTPPPETDAPQSVRADGSFASGDFDDIEQIIRGKPPVNSSPAQVKPNPKQAVAVPSSSGPGTKPQEKNIAGNPKRQAEASPLGKTSRERPPGTLPPASAPIINVSDKPLLQGRSDKFDLTQPREYLPGSDLPPPDWSKPGNSKTRTILISSLLLVGFLGVIAAIIALLNQSNSGSEKKQVAQAESGKPDSKEPEQPISPKDGAATVSEDALKADANPPKAASSENAGATPSEVAKSKEVPVVADKKPTDSAPLANDQPVGPSNPNANKPAEGEAAEVAGVSLPGREERPVSPLTTNPNPLTSPASDLSKPIADSVEPPPPTGPTTLNDRLGKLSQLLSGPGTSLTELGDLAQSERTDRLVGLPRYLISQPTWESPVGDPWALPVAEIHYNEVPLFLFISEFSALTGVPICIDALALGQSGIPLDTPVSVDLENTSTGEIIATVLHDLKLERIALSGIEVILPSGSQSVGSNRYPLPKIKDPTPEKFQAMCDSLTKLIDPVSWTLDSGKRKISVEGNELVVANTSTAAAQVSEFLEKFDAATRLLANEAEANAWEKLKSRAFRSQVGLQKALQLEPTLDLRLEEFLHRIYRQTGVTVSVDWAALAPAGWSNLSKVPGDFQAETIEQLLNELSRSLTATWIAVDEQTFQLTSFQEASRRGMLEIYPLRGLAIEPAPLMDILNQTLGAQLRENPAVQFLYVPEINALVVSAPQPLQRQFEAIVSRLKQPKK